MVLSEKTRIIKNYLDYEFANLKSEQHSKSISHFSQHKQAVAELSRRSNTLYFELKMCDRISSMLSMHPRQVERELKSWFQKKFKISSTVQTEVF